MFNKAGLKKTLQTKHTHAYNHWRRAGIAASPGQISTWEALRHRIPESSECLADRSISQRTKTSHRSSRHSKGHLVRGRGHERLCLSAVRVIYAGCELLRDWTQTPDSARCELVLMGRLKTSWRWSSVFDEFFNYEIAILQRIQYYAIFIAYFHLF